MGTNGEAVTISDQEPEQVEIKPRLLPASPSIANAREAKVTSSVHVIVEDEDCAECNCESPTAEVEEEEEEEEEVKSGGEDKVENAIAVKTRGSQNQSQQKTATIRLHYYPEGGWGWVICACAMIVEIITQGLHTAYGAFYLQILIKFGNERTIQAGCLGSLSMAVSLFASPIVVAICRRKSSRLTAVMGGLVSALGCLFTSFASQFHQLFFSYGIVIGLGVVLCKVPAMLLVGQYFKRKRELVESIVQSSTGLGLILQSIAYAQTIRWKGWRLGLQILTVIVFCTFFVGVFYRSASLYHPQRRAILHLKNQKRKIKDKKKTKLNDKGPFFDFTTLKSRTVQILILSSALTSLGSTSPIIYLIHDAQMDGIDEHSLQMLQAFLGIAMILGSLSFGAVVVRDNSECHIARHYLCQAAGIMVSLSFLAMTAINEYHGYVFFVWIFGIFYGGYNYSLKMVTYEKVRARNFSKTWSFIQWSQAIPTALGIPLTGLMNVKLGRKTGYYFCAISVLLGSFVLFLIDVHRRQINRRKSSKKENAPSIQNANDTLNTLSPPVAKRRRSSLPEVDTEETVTCTIAGNRRMSEIKRLELTCISEEGLADNIFDEFDFLAFGDCMTSCDQVENYLMLSEYENNLNKTNEVNLNDLKKVSKRKKSLIQLPISSLVSENCNEPSKIIECKKCQTVTSNLSLNTGGECPVRKVPVTLRDPVRLPSRGPSKTITVIDEVNSTL